ncbi:MAG TPA: AAA family ATPase [Candidatus Angelobacter sp.]|jgi:predicted ATPase
MLEKLKIRNFKAFGEEGAEFRLAPLTILVGPNASGKSAVLEALGLLSQTAARSGGTQSGFNWRGQWVDFGANGEAALHTGNLNAEIELGITAFLDLFKLKQEDVSQEHINLCRPISYSIHHLPKTGSWKHVVKTGRNAEATSTYKPGPNSVNTLEFKNADVSGLYSPISGGETVFGSQLFQIGSQIDKAGTPLPEAQQKATIFYYAMGYLREWMSRGIYLVGPNRLPRSEDQKYNKHDYAVGRWGEDTLNLLSYLFASPKYRDITAKINEWANVFGLESLTAGWARQKELQGGFSDPNTGTPLGLQFSGYGSQQILPVIAQIFAAPKGSSILIEEPEISLHPAAHIDLIRLFADGVRFGQQIVLTTHSSTVPLALSEAAAFGLTPNDVAIYHLQRELDDVLVQKLEVDSNWSIRGWIPSFSAVERKLLKKWVEKADLDSAHES